jgi:glycosyltransferase involved in cell wall biosynthesis
MESNKKKAQNMGRKAPKISVVIPAHNEAGGITPTLEALLAQTYPDFEIIVVDNASTDNTSQVARNFSPKIRVVSESRKGLLHARERGRKEARGHIVANIDADCLPEKTWLEMAAQHFSIGGVVAVSGPYDYYDGHPFFRRSSLLMQNYIYRPVAHILQFPFVRGGAVLIGGNNLIRADILEKMGGYNTSLVFYGEDTDTAKRVAKHGRVVFTPRMKMKTSARRFKQEGTVKMTFRYLFYFFKHTLRRS